MGRKPRKTRTGVPSGSVDKGQLAKLIDARQKKSKSTEVDTATNGQLLGVYQDVIDRFQPEQDSLEATDEPIKSVLKRRNDEPSGHDDFLSDIESESSEVSARKKRKLLKPSLSTLKSSVRFPQLVDWFDCDAPDPFLLACIKSTPNMVPVPDHWQNKREYLSGRSLLTKKPFELPDIIKQTDIEQMRETLQSPEDDGASLKEVARSKVQPKLKTLDIDYRKLYDIFFKIGKTWKPDTLLPFGDMYYENRNLKNESNWKKLNKSTKVGKLSRELREAMKLAPGQLPPWCMRMKDGNLPPSYPDLKIAGLNWGIENLKDGQYGTLSSKSNKPKQPLFGALIKVAPKHIEETQDRQEEIPEPEQVPLLKVETTIENEATREIPKPLYTVLQEDSTAASYKMPSSTSNSKTSSQLSTKQATELEEPANFRF